MPWFAVPTLEHAPDGALVIRKDRPSFADQSRIRSSALGLGGVALVLVLIIFAPVRAQSDATGDSRLRAVIGLFIVLGWLPTMVRGSYRTSKIGRWRIEVDGVEFPPTTGAARLLSRDEIIRVGWYPSSILLVGKKSRIGLRREGMPAANWREVQARAEVLLAPRFNLPTDRRPSRLESSSRLLLRLCLGGPFALAVCASGFPTARPLSTLISAGWLAAMGGFLVSITGAIIRNDTAARRVWRTPRTRDAGK